MVVERRVACQLHRRKRDERDTDLIPRYAKGVGYLRGWNQMRMYLASGLAVILAGCGSTTSPAPRSASSVVPASIVRVPSAAGLTGLDRVIGKDARSLVSLFGNADQDVFGSGTCILDAYLYPPSRGKEPIVTYVDARAPDGKDVDRAACVAALSKRK
jgi:hypothetical protein